MLSVVSGAVLLGFQYALLALGVYISFRILNIPDLTVDGSFTFGIAVSAVLCASRSTGGCRSGGLLESFLSK